VGAPPIGGVGEPLALIDGEGVIHLGDCRDPAFGGFDDRDRPPIRMDHDEAVAGARDLVAVDDEIRHETGRRRLLAGQDEPDELIAQRPRKGEFADRQAEQGARRDGLGHVWMIGRPEARPSFSTERFSDESVVISRRNDVRMSFGQWSTRRSSPNRSAGNGGEIGGQGERAGASPRRPTLPASHARGGARARGCARARARPRQAAARARPHARAGAGPARPRRTARPRRLPSTPMARWTTDLPRFPLLDGPSPLQPLTRFSLAIGGGVEVWVKREDLLPLAFGGNKLRNLEFLVGEALADGADSLVTSGRRWSNHARLTAAAGARAGLSVHLVLSGPPTRPPNPGVRLDELLGATVHVATTDARSEREALLARVVDDLREAGKRPGVIEVGGSGVTGAIGQVLAALELLEDAAKRRFVPDDIVVPSATGGTQAGLLVGLRTGGAATVVRGVAVTPAAELYPKIVALLRGLGEVAGLAPVAESEINLDPDQLGDGYGRPTEAAADATRLLARTEGILVDPIYTAKALAGLIALARTGALEGRRVVFWHAGGTPGLFEPLDA
jgi:1-aminocyclopropane-1-carboxylate deaminase/D-cysteine desulfhydrase-like pyridoxal-dependent ACC family enzyme